MQIKAGRVTTTAAIALAALAVAAGQAQASRSTLTLTVGDQSSPLNAYSWGVSNPVTIGSTSGGAGAGKVKFQDFSVSKDTDAMTPTLLRAASMGEHFPQVGVQFTHGIFTTSYCLKQVFVTSLSNGASAKDDRPTDNVTFAFGALAFDVGTKTFGFDIEGNAPGTPAPC